MTAIMLEQRVSRRAIFVAVALIVVVLALVIVNLGLTRHQVTWVKQPPVRVTIPSTLGET